MWCRDDPGRLQRELNALEAAGITYTLDEDLLEARGVVRIDAEVTIGDQACRFTATYPDEFPYFKPFVTGPNLGFGHHVNPTTGEYCLLGSGRAAWAPSDTLAWLLGEQLNKLVEANQEVPASVGPEVEVAQAEPWSAYLRFTRPREVVIVDSSLNPGDVAAGSAPMLYTAGADQALIRGHVTGLQDEHGVDVVTPASAPARSAEAMALGAVRVGWVQLFDSPPASDPMAWWTAAVAAAPAVANIAQGVPGRAHRNQSRAVQIVLVAFPEETAHRTVGHGWVALVRSRTNGRTPWSKPRFVRVERAGHLDLYTREPRLKAMSDKRIAVVGLGGIGLHLVPLLGCMAPAKMTLIDGDELSAATAIRNAGAFAMSGQSKAEVAAGIVHATQPYTELGGLQRRIGMPRMSDVASEQVHEDAAPTVRDIVADVDLVIDVAADLSVQHFLSDVARAAGVGYLRAEALPGVRSGLVALRRQDAAECWMCWQHHLEVLDAPMPSYEPDRGVQPPGCPDPTYLGAGFDLAAIAAQTAQVAAAYLTGSDGYGRLPADVMTVRFVGADGAPVPPQWESHSWGRHVDCANHGVLA